MLAEGSRVFCLDNFQTGTLENISPLLRYRNFRFLKHDIVEPFELKVEEMYDLACPASPIHYQADPMHTVKSAVYGVINLLDLANPDSLRAVVISTGGPRSGPERRNLAANLPHRAPASETIDRV